MATGRQNLAVFDPSTGIWSILPSAGSPLQFTLGASGDIPVPLDYDGDGIADLTVYRPSTGVWSILTSRSNFTQLVTITFGLVGDIPVGRKQ